MAVLLFSQWFLFCLSVIIWSPCFIFFLVYPHFWISLFSINSSPLVFLVWLLFCSFEHYHVLAVFDFYVFLSYSSSQLVVHSSPKVSCFATSFVLFLQFWSFLLPILTLLLSIHVLLLSWYPLLSRRPHSSSDFLSFFIFSIIVCGWHSFPWGRQLGYERGGVGKAKDRTGVKGRDEGCSEWWRGLLRKTCWKKEVRG